MKKRQNPPLPLNARLDTTRAVAPKFDRIGQEVLEQLRRTARLADFPALGHFRPTSITESLLTVRIGEKQPDGRQSGPRAKAQLARAKASLGHFLRGHVPVNGGDAGDRAGALAGDGHQPGPHGNPLAGDSI
jgi:hypothetical protein